MTVTEHGSLDINKLTQVISEILSDRYNVDVVVTVKDAANESIN